MKTLRRARIGTSTEESLVCVPVLIAHICWSLKSCEVKDLISLMGLTILLAISWGRAMAELVLLCPVCPVCKAAGVGVGLGATTLGPTAVLTDTCIQSAFQKLWKQQILLSSSTLAALGPSWPPAPPSEPRSFQWQPLALTPHRRSSPLLRSHVVPPLLRLVTWVPAEIRPSLCLWMPLPTVRSTEAVTPGALRGGWVSGAVKMLGSLDSSSRIFPIPTPLQAFQSFFPFLSILLLLLHFCFLLFSLLPLKNCLWYTYSNVH